MKKYPKEKNYETVLAITLGLLVFWYFTDIIILIYIALLLVFIGLLIQPLAGYITWFWLGLSHVLGFVMSKIILSVIFYAILFPIAFTSRFFKSDLLQIKKLQGKSYYKLRNHQYSPGDLEDPW